MTNQRGAAPDDWRRLDQDEYLKGVPLIAAHYTVREPVDSHAHCEFCMATFSVYEGDLHFGYCTEDKYYWVCPKCYEDFKDEFGWTAVNQ